MLTARSAYRERPAEAGSSLRELLNHARAAIPKALHAETPIFLMATAGPPAWSERSPC